MPTKTRMRERLSKMLGHSTTGHPMITATDEITYWHMEWDTARRIRGDNRTAIVSLDLPQDILFRLLVTPTSKLTIQNRSARFFTELAQTRFDAVLTYLRAFFSRMAETCNLSSPELAVTPSGHGSEFDFPRPSPSWIMLEEFCRALQRHPELSAELKKIPVRWL
jgi:hypothetical protein